MDLLTIREMVTSDAPKEKRIALIKEEIKLRELETFHLNRWLMQLED